VNPNLVDTEHSFTFEGFRGKSPPQHIEMNVVNKRICIVLAAFLNATRKIKVMPRP
jgi:hypothetical protein